jgi:hypothetical protein
LERELKKGILLKKSLLTPISSYHKPVMSFNTIKPNPQLPPNKPPQPKPIPLKPKKPGKCWDCQEPWTLEHKFVDPENWLALEQVMEEENHSLLQIGVTKLEQQTPQLLMISSHAAQGTYSIATFSLLVNIGGRKGIALVDSGSTDTFIDYTACKTNCIMSSIASRKVKIAGGGHLEFAGIVTSTPYFIQNTSFSNEFKLLQLQGHDMILGCDWIRKHSPIGLDLRETSRQLIIQKDGLHQVTFTDFTSPTPRPHIKAAKLEKICRSFNQGYIIQINLMQATDDKMQHGQVHHSVEVVLQEFEDIFLSKYQFHRIDHVIMKYPCYRGANLQMSSHIEFPTSKKMR